ncbi:hypothetical protein N7519_007977 [Penicillium mononematosum]|uniref:uncharacterized protein n=1 Tax=Penicillium mononematosum TaxID=268346 RepID=UPI002548B2C7|nr:uncharacterized protein N7519_007977 [Penicillium mononematosum]KAJ6186676.1 hypothetical protein N7519_007977 [Penicillium mononematosum]
MDNLGGEVVAGPDGAEFTFNKQRDALTIVTDYYIFYGEVSVEMKASPGTGIVSSIHMLSDNNDEIDWVSSNLHFCPMGNEPNHTYRKYWVTLPTCYRRIISARAIPVRITIAGHGSGWKPPQEVFHNYTWIWSKEELSWAIDGTVVRTVHYADAKGGTRFPQTPMRIRIGIWAAGDPTRNKRTIGWAGGETDYSNAPFTMYVKSIEIVNYTPAESYVYSDRSGSSDSIKINRHTSSSETSATTDTAMQVLSSTDSSTMTTYPASQNEIAGSLTVNSSLTESKNSTTPDIPLAQMTIPQLLHHLETTVENILDFLSTKARATFISRKGTVTSAIGSWDLFFLQAFGVIVVIFLVLGIVLAWVCFFSRICTPQDYSRGSW